MAAHLTNVTNHHHFYDIENSELIDYGSGVGLNTLPYNLMGAKCTLLEYDKDSVNFSKNLFRKFSKDRVRCVHHVFALIYGKNDAYNAHSFFRLLDLPYVQGAHAHSKIKNTVQPGRKCRNIKKSV